MTVRASTELTTESIWDDTDIVHILNGVITVRNHHTYSGLRLQSSNTESLVVKLGTNAGLTATGDFREIDDRIGGTVQVIGSVGHPVIMTSIHDDTVGAGFTPDGVPLLDTNNNGSATNPAAGNWRGLLFNEFSNDRNVRIVIEDESPFTDGVDVNDNTAKAQVLGTLAANEKSGSVNAPLGYEVHGTISLDDPSDIDVYKIVGTAGTEVWVDLDRTSPKLDLIVELVNKTGTVLARSTRVSDPSGGLSGIASPVADDLNRIGDFYTTNFRDPGMRFVLPGTAGSV
ncbi:MAG: hypothetical protein KDA59_22045, partial [Planctomycetales bacterium]|nr:hypothetical protein [Planctomycetales bacterium]